MHHFIEHFLQTASAKGVEYHVSPTIFVAVYALHYPLVWSAFAWILVAFRRKQNITTPVTLWIFTMLIPWFYPLFFGKLPWYYNAALVGLMVFIVWHGYHKIQNRVAKERKLMTATTSES